MFDDASYVRLLDDGAIEFDYRPEYTIALRISNWSNHLKLSCLDDGQWSPLISDPGFPVVNTLSSDSEAYQQFIKDIPAEILQAVQPYQYRQIPMLQYCSKSPVFAELVVRFPILGWLLAIHGYESGISYAHIDAIASTTYRAILNQILSGVDSAFKAQKSSVRLLQKLTSLSGKKVESELILNCVRNHKLVHSLRHLAEINIEALALIHQKAEELPTALLIELISNPEINVLDVRHVMEIWYDTRQLGRVFQNIDVEATMSRVSSEQELNMLHDRWTEKSIKFEEVDLERIKFPPPPISGTEQIIPIRNAFELKKEGEIMRHCVSGYRKKVLSGRSYIYRVIAPERATLEIAMKGDVYRIGQLRGKSNRNVSDEISLMVNQWVNKFKRL